MTVSPRKRSLVVGRLRPTTKAAKDSPPQDDWLAAENFQFAESPVFSRRATGRKSAKSSGNSKNTSQQNRRQSVLLKRLDLPVDLVSTSPNMRRTRRQSMGNLRRNRDASQEPTKGSKLPRAVSEKSVKDKNVKNVLPPKPLPTKKEPTKSVKTEEELKRKASDKIEVVISPMKFYSSPEKRRKAQRRTSFEMAIEESLITETRTKRKAEDTVSDVKLDGKKQKGKTSTSKLDAKGASTKKAEEAISPIRIKSQKSPSATKAKNAEKSSPSPAAKKGGNKKSPASTKKSKKGELASPSPTAKKSKNKKSPASTKKAKKAEQTSPSPAPKKADNKKSPAPSKKSTKVELTSPSPASKKADSKKSPASTKKSKKVELTSPSPVSKKGGSKKSPASTKKTKKADLTSPSPPKKAGKKSLMPAKKQKVEQVSPSPVPRKAENKKSPMPSSLRKTSKVSIGSPVSILKRLSNGTPESSPKVRLTRSAIRSSQRVRLVGTSPSPSALTFRKTPKSSGKQVSISTDDLGSSPALSARVHLQMMRCNSPLGDKRKASSTKVKPFTPKPDPPPRNLLKQNMKKKVAKNMTATTKVEIHRLMDEEISTPRNKRIRNTEEYQLTPKTPVSNTDLPPTPRSSRKSVSSVVSRRSAIRSTDIVHCKPPSASPRSSTPIEEDNSLDELSVDPVTTTFSQEEEESVAEPCKDTTESEPSEQPKRSYCTLM